MHWDGATDAGTERYRLTAMVSPLGLTSPWSNLAQAGVMTLVSPRAAGTAGAVDVNLRRLRDGVVDDARQVLEVDAARRYVGREFRGTSTCTHLNDLLRSLADLSALLALLPQR